MRDKLAIFLLVVAAALATSVRGSTPQTTLQALGDGLMCQCGCAQTVNACNHVQCPSRSEMTELAQKEIAAGKDQTAILQDFVLRYGVRVLASPPAKGFNRTVWILPAAGLVVGLVVVIAIVRRWQRPSPPPPTNPPGTIDPKILAVIEEEMKKVAG